MNIYIEIVSTLSKNDEILKEYIDLCTKCQVYNTKKEAEEKLQTRVESHHILPKCFKLGGEHDKSNLVYLSIEDHHYAHKLLKDLFDGELKKKMCFAYSRIVNRHGSKSNIPIEEYIKIKNEVSKLIVELNSNRIITDEYRHKMSLVKKNTRWINDGVQELMISKTDPIPTNFKVGRIINQNKGRIWINNGIVNKMVTKDHFIPIGWSIGMFKTENKKGA